MIYRKAELLVERLEKLKLNKMITFEEIDVTQEMNEETFTTLVMVSNLTPEEKEAIPAFFTIYRQFIDSASEPIQAWTAIRNIILLKRAQDDFVKSANYVKFKDTPKIPVPMQEFIVKYTGPIAPVIPMQP